MAIEFVGNGSFAEQATGTLTPGLPAGWAPGDLWLCAVTCRGTPVWPGTGGAGWTLIASPSWGGDPNYTRLFYRRAQAGDTAPVGEFDGNSCARIAGFRGVIATGTPYEGLTSGADTTADTTLGPTGGITVTKAASLIVVVAGGDGDDPNPRRSSISMSGVSNLTERFDNGSSFGSGQAVAMWTAVPDSLGTTGGLTATNSLSMRDAWVGIALLAAPTGRNQAQVIA